MFRYNLELTLRSFLRDKTLTAWMVLTIGLGVGACMTTLTVHHVLSGDPVPGRSQTLFYPQLDPTNPTEEYVSGAEPEDRMTRFDAEALLRDRRADRQAVMVGGRAAVRQQRNGLLWYTVVQARYTSGDFFAMFNTPFLYGGAWGQAEDDNRGRVAVIAKPLNDRLFGGANSVGQSLLLGRSNVFRIIGVLDDWRPISKFYDPGRDSYGEPEQVFLPFSTSRELGMGVNSEISCWGTASDWNQDAERELGVNAACTWLQYWVQLDTPAKAEDYRQYLANYSDQQRAAGRYVRPTNVRLRNLRQWLDYKQVVPGDVSLQELLAFGLLLLCQLNAMDMLHAKFLRGSAEIGLRRALGASRRAIFAQLLTEAGVVGLAGGLLGLGFALLGVWVVRLRSVGYAEEVQLDLTMLVTTFVLAVATTMLAGLLPAWRACRIAPGLQMKSQGKGQSRGRASAATGLVHWLRRRALNEPQAHGSQPARFVPDLRESKKSDRQARPWTPAVAWVQMLLLRMGITEIRPIFSALRHSHKTAATLIVLKVALSCAVLCNAMFLIGGRVERLSRPSGLAEQEIVRVQMGTVGAQDNPEALTREDLVALRALPGVRAASTTNTFPFERAPGEVAVKLTAEQTQPTLKSAGFYLGGEQLLETLGVNLVAGRHFRADEYGEWERTAGLHKIPPVVIITRAMADKLFPGQNPLGQSLYVASLYELSGKEPSRVVGIVERLVQVHEQGIDPAAYEYSMIFPVHVAYTVNGYYLLRVKDPAQRAQVLQAAIDVLRRSNPNRVVLAEDTLEEMRGEYYRQDREMAWIVAVVCLVLLVITAGSIVGRTSFWVSQRTHQIGIRRALGATRGQILWYFQLENLLLTTLGIVLGMGLAYGLNSLLMAYYELPRLPLMYLPIGAVTLWLLGQLSVLGPALRAAAVPPAAATRIV